MRNKIDNKGFVSDQFSSQTNTLVIDSGNVTIISGTLTVNGVNISGSGGGSSQKPVGSYFWNANGLLYNFTTTASGTFNHSASFDGFRTVITPKTLTDIVFTQQLGGNGVTTIEVYRRRSSTNLLLETLNISDVTDFQWTYATAFSGGTEVLQNQDLLFVQFTSVQSGSAENVCVEVRYEEEP
jgi:hypothetical protein